MRLFTTSKRSQEFFFHLVVHWSILLAPHIVLVSEFLRVGSARVCRALLQPCSTLSGLRGLMLRSSPCDVVYGVFCSIE